MGPRFVSVTTPLDGAYRRSSEVEQRPSEDGAAEHSVPTSLTRYWWTGDDLLAEESGPTLTEYAMWDSIAEALWEDCLLRHVVHSQQGVPYELLDDRGHLVWRGEYDDWGALLSELGTTRPGTGSPRTIRAHAESPLA